jgi:hypothetical protein
METFASKKITCYTRVALSVGYILDDKNTLCNGYNLTG